MVLELPGERRLGNYQIMRLLGRGGYADVYLGKHIYLGTPAAVKVLDDWYACDERIQQFQIEARMLARLRHRHIVRVLDFGLDNTTPYLVMENAPHGNLRRYFPQGTPLPLATVLPIVLQTASALQYIHNANLIHCDVKPENLLLGPGHEVWLSDFGIAKSTRRAQLQGKQKPSGTAAYSAPEQIYGMPVPASDQYALGITVYELLCGQLPFQGPALRVCSQHISAAPPDLRDLNPAIPSTVERIVLKALAKDPQHRFGTVLDFALALKQAYIAEEQSMAQGSGLRSLLQRIIPHTEAPAPEERAISAVSAESLIYA